MKKQTCFFFEALRLRTVARQICETRQQRAAQKGGRTAPRELAGQRGLHEPQQRLLGQGALHRSAGAGAGTSTSTASSTAATASTTTGTGPAINGDGACGEKRRGRIGEVDEKGGGGAHVGGNIGLARLDRLRRRNAIRTKHI